MDTQCLRRSGKTHRARAGYCRLPQHRKKPPELISYFHQIVSLHSAERIRKDLIGRACPHRLHIYLYKLLRFCFEERIQESRLLPVSVLLQEIYKCEGNFQSIFSIVLTDHVLADVNILYPGCAESNLSQSNLEACEYYLHHISLMQLDDFGEDNRPHIILNQPVDNEGKYTPLSAATVKRDPNLVLLLLRYGATFSCGVDTTLDPMEQLVNDMNSLYLFRNTGFSEDTKRVLTFEDSKVKKCLGYFRRAMRKIPFSISTHLNTIFSNEDEEKEIGYSKERNIRGGELKKYSLHPELAATLCIRCEPDPISLKHLCRCLIRECILGKLLDHLTSSCLY
ncbi:hypothetical protein CHS0354_033874 [Potamilus streckersoni]|uniref:SOCS box domain-containing protein n=1 Tax=Potamilus streckersoni TaxID=2493646 RepID=A0AAE0VKM6_9BIVA|nr:hypothetical protein CHS0354_033874 [Potamilus streckersoni]